MATRTWKAIGDSSLVAQVIERRPLHYLRGPDASLDRPAHVRAASGMARFGGELVVVQDDAAFLAVVDGASGVVRDVPLPAGTDGIRLFGDDRGNKAQKLDLEAIVVLPTAGGELLLGLGSGSTRARERVVIVERTTAGGLAPRLVPAPALYAALRAEEDFAGSELNVEGAFVDGEDLVLVQRGNGDATGERTPVDATVRLDAGLLLAHLVDGAPLPPLREVVAYELGHIDAGRLTFTDAAWHEGTLVYCACAEASPDVTRDGPVGAVAIGVLPPLGAPRFARLLDERGMPSTDKVEGLVSAGPGRLLGVVDRDDTARPAELLTIAWSG